MRRNKNKSAKKQIDLAKTVGKGYNKFWNDKHFYRVVKGSRGSKKSSTTALNIIYRMLQYDWANTLVLRRTGKTNRASTFKQLVWAIHQLGVEDYFTINNTLPEIRTLDGRIIMFAGLDEPLKLTSITVPVGKLSWVWLEEAFEFESWDNVQTVIESIRGKDDNPEFFKQITITLNPWSELHWIKKQFFDQDGSVDPDMIYSTTTTYRANEWLDEQDISRYEALRERDPRRARIVLDGEWGISDGLVFEDRFEVRDIASQELAGTVKFVGQDFGQVNDPSTINVGYADIPNRKVYLTQEYHKVGATRQDLHNAQVNMNIINDTIFADKQEILMINELRDMGAKNMFAGHKGKGSVEQGLALMSEYQFIIDPSLVETVKEFNLYSWKKDPDGKSTSQPEDANNHHIDAIRYGMQQILYGQNRPSMSQADKLKRLKDIGF